MSLHLTATPQHLSRKSLKIHKTFISSQQYDQLLWLINIYLVLFYLINPHWFRSTLVPWRSINYRLITPIIWHTLRITPKSLKSATWIHSPDSAILRANYSVKLTSIISLFYFPTPYWFRSTLVRHSHWSLLPITHKTILHYLILNANSNILQLQSFLILSFRYHHPSIFSVRLLIFW